MVAPTRISIEEVESPRLRELLERVEHGEVIELVRDGRSVACVTASRNGPQENTADAKPSTGTFIERLMRLREEVRKHNEGKPPLTMEEIISWKHEGHSR